VKLGGAADWHMSSCLLGTVLKQNRNLLAGANGIASPQEKQ